MVKLIATDMDGTLLTPDKKLPKELPRLLEELYRRDVIFAVASGRSHMTLTPLFREMAEEMIFLCDNGACIIYPHEAPTLHSLPTAVIHKVLDLCKHLKGTVPVLCGFHHIYFQADAGAAVQEEIGRYYKAFQRVPYESLYQVEEPILKIALCNMKGTERHTYPMVHQVFGDSLELLISGAVWMDIMCKGIHKGAALADLQERTGISPSETMVFGDYDNDVSMFSNASLSYAMENAPNRVREQARFLAPDNTKNGVVRTICHVLGISMDALR